MAASDVPRTATSYSVEFPFAGNFEWRIIGQLLNGDLSAQAQATGRVSVGTETGTSKAELDVICLPLATSRCLS